MRPALRLSIARATATDGYIWRTYLAEQWRGFLWGAPGQAAGLACMAWLVHTWPIPTATWASPLLVIGLLWLSVGALARRFARITTRQQPYSYARWRLSLLACACVQSGVWGSLGFVLLPAASDPWRATLVISILVFAYTAMVFSIHDFAMTLAGVVPCLAPLLLRLALDARIQEQYLIAVVLFSIVTCLAVAQVIGAKLLEADRLRAEKVVLAEQLQVEIAQATAAREHAERADRQKSDFFAAASHDLRQPLHALMLLTGHLRHSLREPAPLHIVSKISQALGSLSLMFERMFDVARIDAHKVDNQPRACSLQTIFQPLDNEFSVLCGEKGLSWQVRADTHPAQAWVHADPLLAERVLRNFLNNAVRYTQTGGVLLRLRRRGDLIVCQVWDSGCGIAREHRPRIFDDYFQADNPARHLSEGLGLGLAVVRRLAHLAGWPIAVRSRPGRGSCFSLSLPVVAARATPPGPDAQMPAPVSGLIALLDGDAQVLGASAQALQRLGWQVAAGSCLGDLMQAIAQADRMPVALVCDFRLHPAAGDMQARDGLADAALLRHEFGVHLPALLVTADGPTAQARLAQLAPSAQAGISLLRKPLDPLHLHQALLSALGVSTPPTAALAATPAGSSPRLVAAQHRQ